MRRRGSGEAAGEDAGGAPDGAGSRLHWPPRLVKIRIGRASKGTGWAVGDRGILVARHVIEPLIGSGGAGGAADGSGPADTMGAIATAEIVAGASSGRSFEATLVWHQPADGGPGGLALLKISEKMRTTWTTMLRSAPDLPIATPRAGRIDGAYLVGLAGRTAVGSESSTVAWMLAAPEAVHGTLLARPEPGEPAVFEVHRTALARSARKQGLPGAIVLSDEPIPMVLGTVTAIPRGRRTVRFDVATLPDPTEDPGLASALAEVGAAPVAINMDGPILQRFLRPDSLDESLRIRTVADVDGPGFFGVARARTDIAGPEQPYSGWVSRPERARLDLALDTALAGDGPRFLVVRGPSAAGKSRLVAEVLTTHSALRSHHVLVPLAGVSILDLPRRLLPPNSVIFIDNLQDLPATALTHESVRSLLGERTDILFVATVLDLPEVSGGTRLVDAGTTKKPDEELGASFPLAASSLSGVLRIVDDDVLTRTIVVRADAQWAKPGGSSSRSEWALARAKKQGLGLGEYLAGYHELADHYTAALWPTRALVDLVGDWRRSGVGVPLSVDTARMLWERLVPTAMPREEARLFAQLTASETEKRWRAALAYATSTIAGCATLVEEREEGLVASDFTRVHIDQGAIDAVLWEYLMREYPATPQQRVDIGLAALRSGTAQRALRAFESVLFFADGDTLGADQRRLLEVIARRGIAIYHGRMGRDEQAILVYTDLVDTYGAVTDADICEQVAQALLGIGLTFSRLGSHGQAVSAYTELVSRYQDHPSPILAEFVAKGLLGQATTLGALNRHEEEQAAHADIVARFADHPDGAVLAIVEIARRALGGGAGGGDLSD